MLLHHGEAYSVWHFSLLAFEVCLRSWPPGPPGWPGQLARLGGLGERARRGPEEAGCACERRLCKPAAQERAVRGAGAFLALPATCIDNIVKTCGVRSLPRAA
jgi:hypothetical protein